LIKICLSLILLGPEREVQGMQEKTALDVSPTLPTVAFYSNLFALDQLAQSAPHQKGLFHDGAFGWVTALQAESRGFDSRWCHWNFSVTYFGLHYGPGVDSTSNRNEYQKYSLGSKGCWVGLATLILSCGDYLEIWELQTPVASGPFRPVQGLLTFITIFLWMEYVNILRAKRKSAGEGTEIAEQYVSGVNQWKTFPSLQYTAWLLMSSMA